MSNKILVALIGTQQEVILGTTVIRGLKEKSPEVLIDVIASAQNTNLLDGNPDISKIISKEDYYSANVYYSDNIQQYDKFLRVGFTNVQNAAWHHIDGENNCHLVDVLAMRAGLGKLNDKKSYIFLSKEDVEDVNDYWADLPSDKQYFAIHTTASADGQYTSRDIDINALDKVAAYLISNGISVIQVGLSSDRKLRTPGIVDFTSKFTFKQNMEVLSRCIGFIGPDSGMAYLSAASGAKTIILLSSTQFTGQSAGPSIGPRQDNVFYLNAPKPNAPTCLPACFSDKCLIGKALGCSEHFDLSMIGSAIEQVLNKKD